MAEPIITVDNLYVSFRTMLGRVNAVNGVDLTIRKGEVHCLVGESGCGKSVTARAIMRILGERSSIDNGFITMFTNGSSVELTSGKEDDPHILGLRGGKIAMIFQEPMSALSPVHTVGDQIAEMLLLHSRVTKEEALRRAVENLKEVGIAHAEQVVKMYAYELSGGMRQRAMIAMALMCHPIVLIADEPTTSLDVTIQAQILELLNRAQETYDMTVILITHNMGVVAEMADTVSVMYLGKVVESGPSDELFNDPKHPYTQKLMAAVPKFTRERGRTLEVMRGTVPDAYNIPRGCPFHPRCEHFMPGICDAEEPDVAVVGADHSVRCYLYNASSAGSGDDE